MIIRLQKIKWLNLLWGLLALFMLNISIDVVDDTTYHKTEDLSFNEQESIIEYVLEEMMGIEDAIPESEDNDASQNANLKKGTGTDVFILAVNIIKQQQYFLPEQNKYPPYPYLFNASGHTTILSPPPEA